MSPAIRLGDRDGPRREADPPAPINRLRRRRVTVGGIETRATWSQGEASRLSSSTAGWTTPTRGSRSSTCWPHAVGPRSRTTSRASALPRPLDPTREVLDQLVDFGARAVIRAAERSGKPVVLVGNSLGGWSALRLAQHQDLPIAGVVAIGPAGIRMAPLFFTVDRIPAVSQLISVPAPVPEGVVRSVAGRLYRRLAFGDPAGVDQAVVDRFTRFTADRAVIRTRIDYAKRVRANLDDPFDPERIKAPVTVLWGDRDRLCIPAGADDLAKLLPHARIEMLKGIGHTPQIECPEVVAGAIEDLAG